MNVINAIYREAGTRAMQRTVKLQSESKAGLPAFARGEKVALLFGAGYCALHLAPHLQERGYRVFATVRNTKKDAWLRRRGVEPIGFTGSLTNGLSAVLKRSELIVSSIPPLRDGIDPVLSVLGGSFEALAPNLKWTGYLSATSVYGDRRGQWAFEDELLFPSTARGRARVEAELAWLETGWPVHVFRLAGIYGPQIGSGESRVTRNPLERLQNGKARAVIKDGHIVNRIHVDDITAALLTSIAKPNPARVYNIADGHPAPPQDVLDFGARLLGLPLPPRVSLSDPDVSDMARSFYKDNKRVDISRAKAELNFAPQHKDYRLGLISLAQSKHPNYVYLAGHITMPECERAHVLQALPHHIALSRAEEGCLRFDVTQDEADASKLHVFEIFKSQESFDAHQARREGSAWVKASKNCPRDYVVKRPRAID